ncbi:rod shape-determining protein MreC [Borreliella bavariensis]|uniref:rod shape-determining protein MreC n=1 Tax=Borreliella bavariensis TaxID=664662 RepID=UPI001BFFF356|nr:rod shape-determining protein MreC [Borreliella bavariensis]
MNFLVKFKNFIKVLLVLIVSLVFMIYDSSSVERRRPDNFLFFTFSSYIQSRMHGAFSFISNVFKTVNEYKNYKDKIEFYKKRIQQLEIVTQNIQSLRQENIRLKEQLNFYSSSSSDFISAEIIYLNYSNISTLMAINKGFNDGIEKDMIAVAYQDGFSGLVGKVVKVYSNTAKILPLTNYENFVSARIQSSRFIGLIEGNGYGKKLEMNYVNRLAEKDLKIGDPIVTAGFSEYPVGIYIGKITNFHILDYNSLLKIEVEPAIVLDKLEYVFLVKNNKEISE